MLPTFFKKFEGCKVFESGGCLRCGRPWWASLRRVHQNRHKQKLTNIDSKSTKHLAKILRNRGLDGFWAALGRLLANRRPPGRSQDAPRRPRTPPRTPRDAPRRPQDAPKSSRIGPRAPPDASREAFPS